MPIEDKSLQTYYGFKYQPGRVKPAKYQIYQTYQNQESLQSRLRFFKVEMNSRNSETGQK